MRADVRWILSLTVAEAVGIGYDAALGTLAVPALEGASDTLRGLLFLAVLSIGVVEGSALSLAQASALRLRLPRLRLTEWAMPTVSFATLGWGLGMAGAVFGHADAPPVASAEPPLALVLVGAAAIGALAGALLGGAQWLVLRHHARGAGRWVLLQIPGWALAMAAIFAGFMLPADDASGTVRVVAGLAGGALGGLLLGITTARLATRIAPWVAEDPTLLAGKRAVLTGGTSGIGAELLLRLSRCGAELVLLGRRESALKDTCAELVRRVPGAKVRAELCDLSSRASIDRAISALSAEARPIDLLIHDAGAAFFERGLTEDGAERTLAIDLLGPARLTEGLLPLLTERARIGVLTGIYQRRGRLEPSDLHFAKRAYSMGVANAQAQRGRFLWVASLASRFPQRFVFAVHPGAVRTRALEAAPAWMRLLAATLARPAFVRAELGALPALRLLADEDLPTGRFWDRFTLTEDVPRVEELADLERVLAGA